MRYCRIHDTEYFAVCAECKANRERPKLPQISEREKIATEIERMYGPHDRKFKVAIEIADRIRSIALDENK